MPHKTSFSSFFFILNILYIVSCSVPVKIEGMESRCDFALALRLDRSAFFVFSAHPCQNAGTSEQARKSLILNRKTCSVTRTTTEPPEQKTELSTGIASFKQTVNDATHFRGT
jgi:hypothetical protein